MDKFSFVIRRRDMLDTPCIKCQLGEYVIIYYTEDDHGVESEEFVECPRCADSVPRWLTKKEILSQAYKNNEN